MKTRTGFVSNSSSSSFVLARNVVSEKQLGHIQDHLAYAKLKGWQQGYTSDYDAWDITVTDTEIRGYTSMDNFDMREFLDYVGVPTTAVTWGEY